LWGPSIYQSGYYTYTNPYVSEPTVIQIDSGPQIVMDYTQPIPAEPVYGDQTGSAGIPSAGAEAPQLPAPDQSGLDTYADARDLFYDGDYSGALAKANQALGKLPSDATLHQFRALCQFATGDYRSAAAAINSVLSVGPGWDWTTLASLYASTDTYATQLRSLEAFVEQNPRAAFGHFLLAYHYITCGYNEEAVEELRSTLELEPSDQVAANLLGILDPPEPPAASRRAPTDQTDLDVNQLLGSWTAVNGTTTIDLQLGDEGKFQWVVKQQDSSPATLAGEFSLADNKLMLQPREGGPLVGFVTPGASGFNFRVAGTPPGDKGLDFRQP
jgi:tetratricopeptide (TPR) repeat protein